MLECKSKISLPYGLAYLELIDTCWNVNNHETVPCWQGTGINRYMLECKCSCYSVRLAATLELIDTCWNVNMRAEKNTLAQCEN